MKRTKLIDRKLPNYTNAEEIVNTISHGFGVIMGIIILILCAKKTLHDNNTASKLASCIYGFSMIALYSVSSFYHSLKPSHWKKIFQIVDHCTIYLLIAGTYTPIVIAAFFPKSPIAGYSLLALQWGVSIVAIILNAIDLKRYRVFSYTAYILLGWAIIFYIPIAIKLIAPMGFQYLLYGGISYTIGAVLYAIGSKKPWFHSIFHIFVLLGSFLQFIAIYQYIL